VENNAENAKKLSDYDCFVIDLPIQYSDGSNGSESFFLGCLFWFESRIFVRILMHSLLVLKRKDLSCFSRFKCQLGLHELAQFCMRNSITILLQIWNEFGWKDRGEFLGNGLDAPRQQAVEQSKNRSIESWGSNLSSSTCLEEMVGMLGCHAGLMNFFAEV
jgi:hypothetical protein